MPTGSRVVLHVRLEPYAKETALLAAPARSTVHDIPAGALFAHGAYADVSLRSPEKKYSQHGTKAGSGGSVRVPDADGDVDNVGS